MTINMNETNELKLISKLRLPPNCRWFRYIDGQLAFGPPDCPPRHLDLLYKLDRYRRAEAACIALQFWRMEHADAMRLKIDTRILEAGAQIEYFKAYGGFF